MAKVKLSGRRGRVVSKGKKPPANGVTKPKVPGKTKLQKLIKY
jgi:N-acetylglucosamine kinase-like BadF-type ATPase